MILVKEVKEDIRNLVLEKISKREMFCDKDISNELGYSTEDDVSVVNEEIYRLWSMGEFPSNYQFERIELELGMILRDGMAYNDYMVFYPKGKNPNEHPCPYDKKGKK